MKKPFAFGKISLILGIISLIFAFYSVVSYLVFSLSSFPFAIAIFTFWAGGIFSILGLIFAIIQIKKKSNKKAILGIITSLLAILFLIGIYTYSSPRGLFKSDTYPVGYNIDYTEEDVYNGKIYINEREISVRSLMIGFNEKTKEGLIATSVLNKSIEFRDINYDVNTQFREYCISDINEAIENIEEIEKVEISFWSLVEGGSIDIEYSSGLTDIEKKKYLDELKKELESKWYIDDVQYDGINYAT